MNTATQSQTQERAYIALLGLAEHFRTTMNIRKSIQCLEAVGTCFASFSRIIRIFISAVHFLASVEEG